MSLQFLRHGHYWLAPNNAIGRLPNGMAIFTQRTMLENLHRGNGNRAKRRAGIDPKQNAIAPWLPLAFGMSGKRQ